jgi:hypothetical protein
MPGSDANNVCGPSDIASLTNARQNHGLFYRSDDHFTATLITASRQPTLFD